jgi:hypothetical protein
MVAEVNGDLDNLSQAIRLSVQQPCFPFRTMRIYNLISYSNFIAMGRVRLHRWQSLSDQVIQRFEQISAMGEWSNLQSQDHKQSMVLCATTVACCAGKAPEGEDGNGRARKPSMPR